MKVIEIYYSSYSIKMKTLVTITKLAESVSMISEQSIVATHPHAAASWRGRALCPAAERKRRCTSWPGPPNQAGPSLAKHSFLWRWSSLEWSTPHTQTNKISLHRFQHLQQPPHIQRSHGDPPIVFNLEYFLKFTPIRFLLKKKKIIKGC